MSPKVDLERVWQAARALYRGVAGLEGQGALAEAAVRQATEGIAHLAEALADSDAVDRRRALERARSAVLALLGLFTLWAEEAPPAALVSLEEQTRRLAKQLGEMLAHPEAVAEAAGPGFLAHAPATLPPKEDLPVPLEALQPNSRHCFVCGLENPCGLQMRFFQTGPGEVTAFYRAPACFEGYPGVVHGGIQAAMMDETLGRAVMGTDPETARLFYTAKMTITYRQHVPTEQTLRIVGRVLKDRGRALRSWAGIYDADGNLLTEAEGLLLAVPEEEFRGMDPEALGWRVYPLEEVGGKELGS